MKKNNVLIILIFVMLMLVVGGCRSLDGKTGKTSKPDSVKPPVYCQFKDILVPGDFREKKKHCSVTGTGASATGFMSFYGPVDLTSAVNFFSIQMLKDGWTFVTLTKTSFSSILVFNKDKRWAIVELSETNFTTDLRIAVAFEISRPQSFVKPEAVPLKQEDLGEPKGLIEPSGVTEE